MLDPSTVQQLATQLDAALRDRAELAPLTQAHPGLDLDAAYRVQAAGIALRRARGERLVGFKMGLTSEAKRQQMNLGAPIFGELTDRMRVPADGAISVAQGIHPKIEPEIAFFVARPLSGSVTLEQALAACSGAAPALEILDSRFRGFKYFSLPDVVADNCSSSLFVVGEPSAAPHALTAEHLARLHLEMRIDGTLVQQAPASAISGHPGNSLVELCRLLAQQGRELPAGSVVLAGAATVAESLRAGQTVELRIDGLGSVRVRAA